MMKCLGVCLLLIFVCVDGGSKSSKDKKTEAKKNRTAYTVSKKQSEVDEVVERISKEFANVGKTSLSKARMMDVDEIVERIANVGRTALDDSKDVEHIVNMIAGKLPVIPSIDFSSPSFDCSEIGCYKMLRSDLGQLSHHSKNLEDFNKFSDLGHSHLEKFVDIRPFGKMIPVQEDDSDDGCAAITPTKPWLFYGHYQAEGTQLYISSNGFATLDETFCTKTSINLSSPYTPIFVSLYIYLREGKRLPLFVFVLSFFLSLF